jgi:anti-anti-sigma factor
MSVTINERRGNGAVIGVSGALASASATDFEAVVSELIGAGARVIIADMSETPYVSSAGIGSLLLAHKKVSSLGGRFYLYGANTEIVSLMKLLGVYGSLLTATSYESALAHARPDHATPEPPNGLLRSGLSDGIPESNVFVTPLVLECAECGNFTRVHAPGDYICPSCHTEFTVEQDGTVIF